MSRLAWFAALACASVVVACRPSSPPEAPAQPPPPDAAVAAPPALEDDPPRLADRAVKMFLEWQRLLAAGGECPVIAQKMSALADANTDLIAANQRLVRGPREKRIAVRTELEKREAEMAPVAKAISESPIMEKCSSDPAFARAVDRLAGEG